MDEGFDLYDERLPYDFSLIPDFDGKHGLIFCTTSHALCDAG